MYVIGIDIGVKDGTSIILSEIKNNHVFIKEQKSTLSNGINKLTDYQVEKIKKVHSDYKTNKISLHERDYEVLKVLDWLDYLFKDTFVKIE